jgi:hypothetical protein
MKTDHDTPNSKLQELRAFNILFCIYLIALVCTIILYYQTPETNIWQRNFAIKIIQTLSLMFPFFFLWELPRLIKEIRHTQPIPAKSIYSLNAVIVITICQYTGNLIFFYEIIPINLMPWLCPLTLFLIFLLTGMAHNVLANIPHRYVSIYVTLGAIFGALTLTQLIFLSDLQDWIINGVGINPKLFLSVTLSLTGVPAFFSILVLASGIMLSIVRKILKV